MVTARRMGPGDWGETLSATVELVSPNQQSVALTLSEEIALWPEQGGMFVTSVLPLLKTSKGYTDLMIGATWELSAL